MEPTLPPLPFAVQAGLDGFVGQLRATFGAELLSVVLYGGLAKGEFVPDRSDVNVLVLLARLDVATLDRAAPLLQNAARDLDVDALLLTPDDLARSAAVFPVKFQDIQRHHRVLWGQPVLAGLRVTREHLRLRCAQELKNLLLRSRRYYVERCLRPELVERTLTQSLSTLLINLGVLFELKTGATLPNKAAVVGVASQLGADETLLQQLLALKRGELRPDAAELKRLYDAFLRAVEHAVVLADQLD